MRSNAFFKRIHTQIAFFFNERQNKTVKNTARKKRSKKTTKRNE